MANPCCVSSIYKTTSRKFQLTTEFVPVPLDMTSVMEPERSLRLSVPDHDMSLEPEEITELITLLLICGTDVYGSEFTDLLTESGISFSQDGLSCENSVQ